MMQKKMYAIFCLLYSTYNYYLYCIFYSTTKNYADVVQASSPPHLDDFVMEQDGLDTVENSRAKRPKNTTKSYDARAREFQAWCKEKKLKGGDTVTGPKLHYFLKHEVKGRISRKDPSKVIGVSTFDQYL